MHTLSQSSDLSHLFLLFIGCKCVQCTHLISNLNVAFLHILHSLRVQGHQYEGEGEGGRGEGGRGGREGGREGREGGREGREGGREGQMPYLMIEEV